METLMVIFGCVAANHLGLIHAVEEVLGVELKILNCVKCLTFWAVLFFLLPSCSLITSVSTAFASAYLALWLELALGITDKFYLKTYETFINNSREDYETPADEADDAEGGRDSLSELRQEKK